MYVPCIRLPVEGEKRWIPKSWYELNDPKREGYRRTDKHLAPKIFIKEEGPVCSNYCPLRPKSGTTLMILDQSRVLFFTPFLGYFFFLVLLTLLNSPMNHLKLPTVYSVRTAALHWIFFHRKFRESMCTKVCREKKFWSLKITFKNCHSAQFAKTGGCFSG
jgi:hypothetical protein